VAVDLSGQAGAEAVLAILDVYPDASPRHWYLGGRKRRPRRGKEAPEPVTTTATLQTRTVLPPAGPDRHSRMPSSPHYFVVFTLQSGPAPSITVQGEGLDSKVRIQAASGAARVIRYDGNAIVME
jgi:hypothetical protein